MANKGMELMDIHWITVDHRSVYVGLEMKRVASKHDDKFEIRIAG